MVAINNCRKVAAQERAEWNKDHLLTQRNTKTVCTCVRPPNESKQINNFIFDGKIYHSRIKCIFINKRKKRYYFLSLIAGGF